MKKVEKESLLKSFFLFFLSQTLLLGALFFLAYKKEVSTLDTTLFSKMRICSFNLECKEFKLDFVDKKEFELYKLYKNKQELSAYFSIPNSQKNALKIYLPYKQYQKQLHILQKELVFKFVIVVLVVAFLSFFFALYTLSPLRNALRVTEEFIKDILHDFNTPLSTMRLNISMLQKEFGENKKLQRVQNSVQNILNLQANLKSYLHAHKAQRELFDLDTLLQERVELLQLNYKNISFEITPTKTKLLTNKDSFVRVIDNLLSNAAKYNKTKGKVSLRVLDNNLTVCDTGKGIKNPKRVFERFYKEQERGIGIGLHIVKKLCDEMNIALRVESEVGKGSCFFLNLKNTIL